MPLLPSSSSSAPPTSGGNDSGRPSEPLTDYVISRLCNSAGIPTDGEDICSHTFVGRVLEHVEQDLAVLKGILTSAAKRRPFNDGAREGEYSETRAPPLSPTSHSNGQNTSSTLSQSQIAHNENSEFVEPIIPVLSPAMSIVSVPMTPRPLDVISTSSTYQYDPSPNPALSPFCVISSTYHVQTLVPSETDVSQDGHNENHDNVNRSPALLPILPPEEFGQPQNLTEDENITSVVVKDEFVNSLINVAPSPPRQLPPRKLKAGKSKTKRKKKATSRLSGKKRTKQQVLSKKEHKSRAFRNGFYWCNCGSKFSTIGAQKHHLKHFTSEWKFKCKQCVCKFYDLSKLKKHLTKQHGRINPLAEYAIGCTQCGIPFHTRAEFSTHRKKGHNVQLLQPETSVMSPRYHGMSIRQPCPTPGRPYMTPGRPYMTPGRREPDWSSENYLLMSPRDEEIDVEQNINSEVNPNRANTDSPVSDDEEENQIFSRQSSSQQANLSPFSQRSESGNSVVEIIAGINGSPIKERQIDEINLINSSDDGDDDEEENHMDDFQTSSQQTASGSPQLMECVVESIAGILPIIGEWYGCIMCSHVFANPEQLSAHMREGHYIESTEVRCRACGEGFGSCDVFHEHSFQNHHDSYTGQERQIDSLNKVNDDDDEEEKQNDSNSSSSSSCSPSSMDVLEPHEDSSDSNSRESGNWSEVSSNISDYVPQGKLYTCITCNPAFRDDLNMLTNHLLEKHNSLSKEVKCGLCGEIFESAEDFERHWVKHETQHV